MNSTRTSLLSSFLLILLSAAAPAEPHYTGKPWTLFQIESRKDWKPDSPLCLMKKKRVLACGKVARNEGKGFYAWIQIDPKLLQEGEKLEVAPESGVRTPASRSRYYVKYSPYHRYRSVSLSAGAFGSDRFLFPGIHAQWATGKWLVLGLNGVFAASESGAASLSGVGGFLTAELDLYGKPLDGSFLQFATGMYLLGFTSGGVEDNRLVGSLQLTGGYRFLLDSGLGFSLGGGLNYMADPGSPLFDVDFDGVGPLLRLEAGYSF